MSPEVTLPRAIPFARRHHLGLIVILAGLTVTILTPRVQAGFLYEIGKQTTEPHLSPYNVYLTASLIALLYVAYAKRSLAAFYRVTAVMLTQLALFGLIKLVTWKAFHIFPRPSHGDGGFPSGHTAAVCALAYMLTERWPKLSPLWYACAAFVGWCRWASHAHYPYQIVAGAILGLAAAAVVSPLFPERANEHVADASIASGESHG